ncbi:FG-GAP repeat domain-containing protein [Candidatus Hydrogenedentota bacterium]
MEKRIEGLDDTSRFGSAFRNAFFHLARRHEEEFKMRGFTLVAGLLTIVLLAGCPVGSLFVNKTEIDLRIRDSSSVVVVSSRGSELPWTATSDDSRVTVTPSFGQGDGQVAVSAEDFSDDFSTTIEIAGFEIEVTVHDLLKKGVLYDTGQGPVDMVVASFDTDGLADFVVLNQAVNNISLFRGQTDETFVRDATSTSVGSAPSDIVLGEISGGNAVAVVNTESNSINIMTLSGFGAFNIEKTIMLDGNPAPVAALLTDMDGDDIQDLLILESTTGMLGVMLGLGDFNFDDYSFQETTGDLPAALIAEDLNSDGFKEVVVCNSGNSSDVIMFVGDETNMFRDATVSLGTGFVKPVAVAAGDLTGDGLPELVVASRGAFDGSGSKISVLYNSTGAGEAPSFDTPGDIALTLSEEAFPQTLVLTDMNGDGRLDLVTSVLTGAFKDILESVLGYMAFSIRYGEAGGAFRSPQTSMIPHTAATGSLDIHDDVYVEAYTVLSGDAGFQKLTVIAEDLNGDGAPDLLMNNPKVDEVAVVYNDSI